MVTAAEYDEAAARWPEMCPLYYMGDRRSGQQLLDDFDADALEPHSAFTPATPGSASGCESDAGMVEGGRAWLLERMAAVVTELAGFLSAAGPGSVSGEGWAHAVRGCAAALRWARGGGGGGGFGSVNGAGWGLCTLRLVDGVAIVPDGRIGTVYQATMTYSSTVAVPSAQFTVQSAQFTV